MKTIKPIITSLLDLDFYKFTMAQVAWKYYRDINVKYFFQNRDQQINLANHLDIEELTEQLEYVRRLIFTKTEIDYLTNFPFSKNFLNFLQKLKLPPVNVNKEKRALKIETQGPWPETIWWETIILSIVNELYYRPMIKYDKKSPTRLFSEGETRLNKKISLLKKYPLIKFTDFGTRRRFSKAWQEEVVKKLIKELPNQFIGTSNVFLARKYSIAPIGTFAHEMYMVLSGIIHENEKAIKSSHNQVLQIWYKEYGQSLAIALADNYGSDFFFNDFTPTQARLWRGLRHDSGDPIIFGRKAISFYKKLGIDPREKIIVFSDNLNEKKIISIYNHFKNKIGIIFGWGTNLTNDLGYQPMSIVVKVQEANGYKLVKLTDDLSKATGDKKEIKKFMQIFNYHRP